VSAQRCAKKRARGAVRRAPAVVLIAVALTMLPQAAAPASGGTDRGELRIYYRSPVLVRAGERVRMPVDVVCTRPDGRTCRATVTLSTTDRTGPWRSHSASARPQVQFDLTRPAVRAAPPSVGSGVVSFRLMARAAGGWSRSLPARPGSLRLYVAAAMRRVATRDIPFAPERSRVVMRLPWGTGPYRAGLSPGNEAATVGPSSFDVDERGTIYVLDALQHRVAVFRGRRLVRQIPLPVSPESDIAVDEDGTIHVASQRGGRILVRSLSASGHSLQRLDLGPGILGEIRAPGARPYVHLFPLDAWVTGNRPHAGPAAGIPVRRGGLLLQSIVGRTVRLGVARGDRLVRAVELDSRAPLGELALADRDGRGGLVVVFRELAGADADGRYLVVHLAADGSMRSFALPAETFADQRALSQIRMGRDGALYQLRTFQDGMRIVRYAMEAGS
jgi:hypothetical protein